ncbi:MAG: glycosyltransferase family 9 protein [Acidobacteriota bacterium]
MNRSPQDFAGARPLIDWSKVNRVLLVRLRSIGDTVLMTPCLQALNDWRPDIEIGLVTEPLAAPVLDGHLTVEHVFVAGPSVPSRLRLVSRLRHQGFDVAFNLHGGTTALMLTAMSGARHTVGYRGRRGSWLLSDRAPAPNVILGRERVHSVEQQLALLQWAGVPLTGRLRLSLAVDSTSAASLRSKLTTTGIPAAALASSRFAIVAPGAAFDSKRWSSRGFASVIDHLAVRWQLESIVIAGPGQEQVAREVAETSRSGARVLSGISIGELKALVQAFGRVFVGNDSGPMHIAAAFNCPIVAVFGSSNPDVWHPWTDAAYRVLGGERGVPDSGVRSAIDRIEVEKVIAALDDVLEPAAAESYFLKRL